MKKLLALIASVTLMFSLSACGNSAEDTKESSTTTVSDSVAEDSASDESAPADDSSEAEEDKTDGEGDSTSVSALELLNTVWGSYGEDEKFAVAGGDMSEENMSMDGPGKFGLEDADAVDASLGFPAADVDKIDDAASIMHMMNANTFTCGAYHVKSAGDVDQVVADIKDNVMNRQWLCGFPDKLVVVTEGDCVIAFFGENEIADTFKTKLTAAYPNAQVVVDDAI